MGYSKANERDRAAEGSDNGGEKTGNDQKTISHHMINSNLYIHSFTSTP